MTTIPITGPTMQFQVDCRKGAWVAGQDIERMLDLLCAITDFNRDDMAAAYAIWNAFRPITAVELHYLIFVCALDDWAVRHHEVSVAMFAHLSTMDWHWEFPEALCARTRTIQGSIAVPPKHKAATDTPPIVRPLVCRQVPRRIRAEKPKRQRPVFGEPVGVWS